MQLRAPTIIILSLAAQGCSTSAMFVTKTSLSVVDIDSTPPGASIAYDRVEGFLGPLNPDGTLPPVVAKIENDGKFWNPRIKQVYATGDAAREIAGVGTDTRNISTEAVTNRATGEASANSTSTAALPYAGANGRGATRPTLAFFGTSTSTGLKVEFAETVIPRGFMFGYRRKELSTIPELRKGSNGNYVYPQLLAAIDVRASAGDVSAADAASSQPTANGMGSAGGSAATDQGADVKLGVCQSFATGVAATQLAAAARKGERSLSCGGASAQDLFEDYDESVAVQMQYSTSLLSCYSGIKDGDRQRIWEETARLGLFAGASLEGDAAETKNKNVLSELLARESAIDSAAAPQVIADAKRSVDGLYTRHLIIANIGGRREGRDLLGNPAREKLLQIHKNEVCRISGLNTAVATASPATPGPAPTPSPAPASPAAPSDSTAPGEQAAPTLTPAVARR